MRAANIAPPSLSLSGWFVEVYGSGNHKVVLLVVQVQRRHVIEAEVTGSFADLSHANAFTG